MPMISKQTVKMPVVLRQRPKKQQDKKQQGLEGIDGVKALHEVTQSRLNQPANLDKSPKTEDDVAILQARAQVEEQIVARMQAFTKSTLWPVATIIDRYPDNLPDNIHISPITIALEGGRLPKGHEEFLLPMPAAQVDELFDAIKLKPAEREDYEFHEPGAKIWNDRFTEAQKVWDVIYDYATYRMADRTPAVYAFTDWKIFETDTYKYRSRALRGTPSYSREYVNWNYWATFRMTNKGSETKDASKPHTNAFIWDDAPQREGKISTSEVQAVLWVAFEASMEVALNDHKIIPVTLISGSQYTVRVVQGIVNTHTHRVDIRMSDIVDLTGGCQENFEKFKRIFAWLIGTPVGITT